MGVLAVGEAAKTGFDSTGYVFIPLTFDLQSIEIFHLSCSYLLFVKYYLYLIF